MIDGRKVAVDRLICGWVTVIQIRIGQTNLVNFSMKLSLQLFAGLKKRELDAG